ncbi:MAG TPA: shikimate dehydrogenase [Microscillaceae bacterium]|nr:shikimate dehydrogenase [Microscillaceae bacterium]
MRQFGLIGYPLSHSFSKKYFTEKFERENIAQANYELYELSSIDLFPALLAKHPDLVGLNVTIPYKQAVMPYLDALDTSAQKVGAVNVIKIENGKKTGFNSDYYGFKQSLINSHFPINANTKALVLGSGGASKAVIAALSDLAIQCKIVSRNPVNDQQIAYKSITSELIANYQIIVNTTPLGMHPHTNACPDLPYEALNENYLLFDLLYNPSETLFMKKGAAQGAQVLNGLEMLHLQAEKSWKIWNQ